MLPASKFSRGNLSAFICIRFGARRRQPFFHAGRRAALPDLTRVPVRKAPRRAAQPRRIDLDQDADLARWAKTFGITVSALRDAIAVVGPQVNDVARYLASGETSSEYASTLGAATRSNHEYKQQDPPLPLAAWRKNRRD